MSDNKPSIAVDFDGVLHQYVSPWTAADEINDPPMPGAFKWLEEMVKDYNVIIHSCRITPKEGLDPVENMEGLAETTNALRAVIRWFAKHGLPGHVSAQLQYWVSTGKPHAILYIDDHGYHFEGHFPTTVEIQRLPVLRAVDVSFVGEYP